MDDALLEYTSAYKSVYKDKFHQTSEEYFSSLVEKSGVNVDENKHTAEQYRETKSQVEKVSKLLGKKKGLRTFLIVLAVLALLAAVIALVLAGGSSVIAVNIVIGVLGIAGFVAIIVVIAKIISPAIKNADQKKKELESKAQELYETCMQQLQPLFALYDNYCTFELIEKTVPLFKFDRNFNMKRHDYFRNKYGHDYAAAKDRSTVDVFSGEINGNPFFLQKEFDMEMGMQTYQGSLTITWTETVRDSNGHSRTVVRHQTLVASVSKPKPFYSYFTRLVFANDVAPDLSFSRQPGHAEKLSEKELASRVKSGQKQIQKQAAKAVKSGGSFTEMGNPEFDVLFGATDRDNEVQFRLMFTPLAQKNMLTLMKTPDPFGDDFVFIKNKRVNFVASEHSQRWDYSVGTQNFVSYDIDLCQKQFIDYNDGFFRSLYFEFAPLMSIPLYQQYKPTEYIYQHEYESHNTMYEAEVLANRMNVSNFCHPNTKTDTILSARLAEKRQDEDIVQIDAYSFDTEDMVELVPKLGGDGRIHNVPVHWLNYIPLENQTLITVSAIPEEKDTKRDECNGDSSVRHGLLAKLMKK